jgi:DNA-directed RNA polymerase subunit E'/Rpb7
MFMPIKFNTTIILIPKELNHNYEQVIISKVKNTLENSCSKHGYIKKDSIKIIKRSSGYIKESHLNGNIAFDLCCIAEICNPIQDSVIKCVVKAKNNLGLRAIGMHEDMAILEVIIPRITSGIQSEVNIDEVKIGDIVNVLVCGKKFTLYDKMISIVGKILKDKNEEIIISDVEDDEVSIEDENDDDLQEDGLDIIDIENEYELNNDDEEEYDEEEEEDGIKKINIKLKENKKVFDINDEENDEVDDEDDDEDDDDDDDINDDENDDLSIDENDSIIDNENDEYP